MSRNRKYIILLHHLFGSFPDGRSGVPPCGGAPQQHPPAPDGVYLIPHKTEGLSLIGKKGGMYRRTPQGFNSVFSGELPFIYFSTIFSSCKDQKHRSFRLCTDPQPASLSVPHQEQQGAISAKLRYQQY